MIKMLSVFVLSSVVVASVAYAEEKEAGIATTPAVTPSVTSASTTMAPVTSPEGASMTSPSVVSPATTPVSSPITAPLSAPVTTPATAPVVAPVSTLLKDGTKVEIAADNSVTVINDDGTKNPAPDGIFMLRDGGNLVVKNGNKVEQ